MRDWFQTKIGEVADVNPEQLKSSTSPDFKFDYIDISSIEKTGEITSRKSILFSEAPSRARRVVRDRDIIVSTVRPNLRSFAMVNNLSRPTVCSTGFAVLRAKSQVSPGFLYQFILSNIFMGQVIPKLTGSNYPAVNSSDISDISINLPPIIEQQKIAEILSSVDEAIEKTEAIIKQSEMVKKGIMQQLLTKGIGHTEFKNTVIGEIPIEWEIDKLKNLTKKITDGTHHTPKYQETGVPFLRVTDIQQREIDFSSTKYISEEEHYTLIKRCKPEKNDILLSKNGTIGITKLVDWDQEFSIFVSLCLIKVDTSILLPKFIEYFLQSEVSMNQIKLRSKKGTVTNLHLTEIKELICGIPNMIEQVQIVEILEGIDNKIEVERRKLSSVLKLKNSLMQSLLTGKVRVNTDQLEEVLV